MLNKGCDGLKRITAKIKLTYKSIFREITVPEYISWWVIRALLLWAIIACPESEKIMISINFLALFAMSLLRFFAGKDSFAWRISMRCQHIINAVELLGTFFNNFLHAGRVVPNFDRLIHLLSGPLAVLAGYYIYKACFKTKEQMISAFDPRVASLFSCGFSFIIICLWEIMEFFGDFFTGTTNQGYNVSPSAHDFWNIVLGRFYAAGTAQYPLWDTMFDMIDAAITTAVASVVLYVVLKKLRKKLKPAVSENSLEPAENSR